MQLFGLVNTLLRNDQESSRRDLQIVRYSVIPLEPNSGLIEWVPDCDTLHALVKEYRETRKILLNIEHRLMLAMTPDYDQLPLMGKVEVFQHALANTTGQDLNKVLWLKSRNCEDWLERRTNYTRYVCVCVCVRERERERERPEAALHSVLAAATRLAPQFTRFASTKSTKY
jgi:FKBP12-rapamycin complex-associated protein